MTTYAKTFTLANCVILSTLMLANDFSVTFLIFDFLKKGIPVLLVLMRIQAEAD